MIAAESVLLAMGAVLLIVAVIAAPVIIGALAVFFYAMFKGD